MTETKWCPACQAEKAISDFYANKGRTDGLSGYCRECQKQVETNRAHARRRALLDALGGKCVQCGFADERALQVDHINGGGKQVDPYRSTMAFYTKVVANPGEYQLLCANCNWIKKHEREEHIGVRVYERQVPTERKRGVGRWNAEANARRAEGLRRWREENPDANSERARKGNATRRARE